MKNNKKKKIKRINRAIKFQMEELVNHFRINKTNDQLIVNVLENINYLEQKKNVVKGYVSPQNRNNSLKKYVSPYEKFN
jgi:hypothetical protein